MPDIVIASIPQGPLSKKEHVELLTRAIAANLAARVEHDQRQAKAQRGELAMHRLMSAQELSGADRNRLRLDAMIADPVKTALRQQLRELGERLFRLTGSVSAMGDVADQVADMEPGSWGYRATIIDKAWDGVGGLHGWWS